MKTTCSVCILLTCIAASGRADEPTRLQEQFTPGYQYHVSSRVELAGTLTLPPEKDKQPGKPLTVTGESALDYDERVLTVGSGEVQKTMRIYRRIDFQRKVGDQPQENTIRPSVRRLVVLRHQNQEVPFSPDGPLLWGEIDLVRTDVFTPALAGMLPDHDIRAGDRWTAGRPAIQELTDLERIEEGSIECKLDQLTTIDGRRHARITFAGTVRGVNEDGPNRQRLSGYFCFDLESNHLSYISLDGTSFLLDKEGKEVGQVKGRFVLTRQLNQRSRELSDEALRGVNLEPNAANTLLLFEDNDLGLRFTYPRRWKVAGTNARQIGIDAADGSGMLLTVEAPANVPTAAQFLNETRTYLQQQKLKILHVEPAQRLQGPPHEIDHFGLDAEANGQKVYLDYFVLRQTNGGATLAGRLLREDLAALQREAEGIARSIVFTKAIPPVKR